MLIDGYSLAFRAFYALPESLTNSSGLVTNSLHGFTKMLANLVSSYQPTHMAVAFDFPAPTFRDEIFPAYKGHRPDTPESLRPQLQLLRPIVEALGIPSIELQGYEADDVIGTLSRVSLESQMPCLIVTGDRDSYQLVQDPYVTVLYNRRGVSDIDRMDEEAVFRKAGVIPSRYSEYAALRGDPSDNLPGIPGVGEKTAAKLINEYGSIEGIITHVDSLPDKLQASVREHTDQLRINSELSKIYRSVPLSVAIEDLSIDSWDSNLAKELFGTLELRGSLNSLISAFRYRSDRASQNSVEPSVDLEAPRTRVDSLGYLLSDNLDRDGSLEIIHLDIAGVFRDRPGRSALIGLALAYGDQYFVAGEGDHPVDATGLFGQLPPGVLFDGILIKEILRSSGASPELFPEVGLDLGVSEYLLDPGSRSIDLEALSERYLGTATLDSRASQGLFDDPTRDVVPELISSLRRIRGLRPILTERLESLGLASLYADIEGPLVRVLAKMETIGIGVDREILQSINSDLVHEISALLLEIRALVGEELNPNSTKQLAEVLFNRLGLSPGKKTKTGYSTDARTLEKLRDAHPVVDLVLRYRELDKLRSTFAEGLLSEIGDDGRIHATFHQTVARTGRISSDSPNLHNIPIRSDEGRRFREAFVAGDGMVFVVADYSQIELRVIAHLSGDENLIRALSANEDVHTQTAARVFGVPDSEVTHTQRSKAKMVAYGLAYGMEAYGLAQRLGIPTGEAEEILQAYFAAFPRVRGYMDSTIAQAKTDGFTKTLFGRRRYFSDLHSSNRSLRQASERQAMNAGIQGLAADIFKIALIRLDRALVGLPAEVVLQVHDEVLVECDAKRSHEVSAIVQDAMVNAASLAVPLLVNIATGRSWAEAK